MSELKISYCRVDCLFTFCEQLVGNQSQLIINKRSKGRLIFAHKIGQGMVRVFNCSIVPDPLTAPTVPQPGGSPTRMHLWHLLCASLGWLFTT